MHACPGGPVVFPQSGKGGHEVVVENIMTAPKPMLTHPSDTEAHFEYYARH